MTANTALEHAFTFACGAGKLIGIVHGVEKPAKRGVLVIVGGPQYRVGSHRQFALLARALADQHIPTMRFDHSGIGDSDEPYRGFETLDLDIASAIDAFVKQCPGLEEIVLWGLCDAASAIMFYAHRDPRITGIVLLNPWIRTPESEARSYLRHYYVKRLFEPAFWRSLVTGRLDVPSSVRSLFGFVARRLGFGAQDGTQSPNQRHGAKPLPVRMSDGLAKFKGPVLLIMSGQDLTAREFEDTARQSPAWRRILSNDRLVRRDLRAADHTFSRQEWSDIVSLWTVEWVRDC